MYSEGVGPARKFKASDTPRAIAKRRPLTGTKKIAISPIPNPMKAAHSARNPNTRKAQPSAELRKPAGFCLARLMTNNHIPAETRNATIDRTTSVHPTHWQTRRPTEEFEAISVIVIRSLVPESTTSKGVDGNAL